MGAISNKTYTGSAIKPAPVVKDGTRTLKAGTDYTVSYKNNTALGTATITITGKGNYSGSRSVTFKIVKPVSSLTHRAKSITDSISLSKPTRRKIWEPMWAWKPMSWM